jgi:hypothetical protein
MTLFYTLLAFNLIFLAFFMSGFERKGRLVIKRQLPRQRPRTRSIPTRDYPVSHVYDPITPFGHFISDYSCVIPLAYTFLFLISAWFLKPSNFELFSSLLPLLFLILGTENLLRCFFYTEIYHEVTQEQVLPPVYQDPPFYFDFPHVSLFGRSC